MGNIAGVPVAAELNDGVKRDADRQPGPIISR
jgi:hypothetical protein